MAGSCIRCGSHVSGSARIDLFWKDEPRTTTNICDSCFDDLQFKIQEEREKIYNFSTGSEWFDKLKDEEKKYIERHPDPRQLIFYLKQGFSFIRSVLRGYEEHVLEDFEANRNMNTS